MQGLNKFRDNGIHGYIFMTSCGILFGAFIEALYHERVIFAASVIMGVYFFMIHRINRALKDEPIYTRALISTFAITAVELVFGIITNRVMHLHFWDFSDSLFHVLGQICPRESFIRFVIAFPVIYLSKFADRIPIRALSIGETNG
ncbi:MAG: hypothetical protein IJY94_02495 [Clostridia bacterium]|nr:hypothetical protein [Clostridia bacterium]